MDEVNINKYLGQFNPILVVPVLSAVVGAILVFVFGFKRPNEPRFQSSSSIDSLKKSKRKTNNVKNGDNTVQSSKQQNVSSAKAVNGKKTGDVAATVTGKKAAPSSNNNNNNTSSTNNNINKKKTDEKKSENGSPTKKVANKKAGKENTAPAAGKKSKANKNALANGQGNNDKPADFDDGGWFTVQSKSTKQKNKVDDSAANQTESSPPKPAPAVKATKSPKAVKVEAKPLAAQVINNELNGAPENVVASQTSHVEQKVVERVVERAAEEAVIEEPAVVEPAKVDEVIAPVAEKKQAAPAPTASDVSAVVENAVAFDELGDWTDAKPDRKRGNKKKSRKD